MVQSCIDFVQANLLHLLGVSVDLSVLTIAGLNVQEYLEAVKLELLGLLEVSLNTPLHDGEAHWGLDLPQVRPIGVRLQPELVLVVSVFVILLHV